MAYPFGTACLVETIGFEWHNPASTPLKYNATSGAGGGSHCGTAIFWTK